jgi:hypothetical protein
MANAVTTAEKESMNNSEAVIQGGWGSTAAMNPIIKQ